MLRDLVARYDDLAPAEQRLARAILSRPDDNSDPNEAAGTTTRGRQLRQLRLPVHSRLLRQLGHGLDDAATQAFVDDVFASMATVWSVEIDRLEYRSRRATRAPRRQSR